ncbi:hypothetical protein TNCV_656311 [Trichonephila clavipes]|nr:hypothetical protein TNCV_656311 [Trichonephila clavipes]
MNSIIERRVIHQVKISPKISAPKIAASTSNTLGRSVSAETSCAKTSNYKQGTIEIGIARRRLNIAPETTRHLVESMLRRLEAVISAKANGLDQNQESRNDQEVQKQEETLRQILLNKSQTGQHTFRGG